MTDVTRLLEIDERVLAYMKTRPGQNMTVTEIADAARAPYTAAVSNSTRKLASLGYPVSKVLRGVYMYGAPPPSPALPADPGLITALNGIEAAIRELARKWG